MPSPSPKDETVLDVKESEPASFEEFPPYDDLKEKVGDAGGFSPSQILAAEAAIFDVRDDFIDHLKAEIGLIRTAYIDTLADPGRARTHLLPAVSRLMELSGLGGSFGYPLVSRVCTSLCVVIQKLRKPGPKDFAVIRLHIEALSAIAEENITGDGDGLGDHLSHDLAELIRKLIS